MCRGESWEVGDAETLNTARTEPSAVTPDPDRLAEVLEAHFGGSLAEARTVARQARDLADDGRLEEDLGTPLTAAVVVEHLQDAPDGGPADRWNWWIGSLEVAFGGYRAFGVERYPR